MPPKENQKEKDVGWKPHFAYKKPAKEDKNKAKCIVHCTDLKEALSSMPLSQFRKRILEAAKIRVDKRVLEIAESLESEEDFPNIQYHNRCRRVYIHSGTLERVLDYCNRLLTR